MKLCGLKLNSVLFGLLFSFSVLFLAGSTNAAVTIESTSQLVDSDHLQQEYVWMGQYADGPTVDCEDSLMIVSVLSGSGNQVSNVTFNDDAMTQLYEYDTGNPYHQIWYQLNPDSGTHLIKAYQNWGAVTWQSVTLCGVNLDDFPFASAMGYQAYMNSGNISTNVVVADNDSLVLGLAASYSGSGYTANGQTQLRHTSWGLLNQYMDYSAQDATELMTITGSLSQATSGFTLHYLTIHPSIPAYCGDTICQPATENCNTCASDCGVCQNSFWTLAKDTCVQDYPCPLTFYFDQNYFTGNDYIYVYKASGTSATAPYNTYYDLIGNGVINPAELVFNIDLLAELNTFSYPGQTTYPLNNDKSERQLYRAEIYRNGTSTQGTFSGTILFERDWAPTSYGADLWGNPYVYTSPWKTGTSTTPIFTTLFGTSTHALACSAADWADANADPEGWFNWTKMRCNSTESILTLIAKIGEGIGDAIHSIGQGFLNMFPLNIIIQIKSSWETSASSTLPTNLAWLEEEIDQDGNIYINPAQAFASSSITGITDTNIVIWGKNMGGTLPNWEIWRLRIRAIIGYIIISAFLYFQVLQRAYRIKNKLKASND